MTNDHVEPHLRRVLARLADSHREARDELHETIASLNRSANMPKPTMTPATTTSKAALRAERTAPMPPSPFATHPADDYDPEFTFDEAELARDDDLGPEPTVTEVYIGWPVDYCHRVRFASGHVYSVVRSTSGGLIGDYEIHGPGDFYRDGYATADKAIDWLCDPERRDW